MDIVTVSGRCLTTSELEASEVTGRLERRPTSRGSNLWGDSPMVLLLKEAVSDNSAVECNEEMEDVVSSVMAERNGVLSDGDTP